MESPPEREEGDAITQDDAWSVASAYVAENGLARHQLDSFEEFVQSAMQEIVDEAPEIEIQEGPQEGGQQASHLKGSLTGFLTQVSHIIKFGQVYLSKPSTKEADGETLGLSPKEARLRNRTYAGALYADAKRTSVRVGSSREEPVDTEIYEKVFLGKLPIMVRSSFCALSGLSDAQRARAGDCPYDPGGYYIINGAEKVLIAQERMSNGHVYVYKKSPYAYVAEVRSQADGAYREASSLYVRMLSGSAKGATGKPIRCKLPSIKGDVPIVPLFFALGVTAEEHILERICYNLEDREMLELLRPSLEEAADVSSQEAALDYIGGKAASHLNGDTPRARARELLQTHLLPHVGTEDTQSCATNKAYFLGYVIHRLLTCALGRRAEDDREHYGSKRLYLAAPLMGGLFCALFRHMTNGARKYLQKLVEKGQKMDLTSAVNAKIITHGFNYSLATGMWGERGTVGMIPGVSQDLERDTYAWTISLLRHIASPLSEKGKLSKPRQLHNSHWGRICPVETPEGASCGLTKSLALSAYVSVGSPPGPLLEFLDEWITERPENISPSALAESTKIFVNGAWVGVHRDPQLLVSTLRQLRRQVGGNTELGIVPDVRNGELRLHTDAGRLCRPLFVVENGKPVMKKRARREETNNEDGGPVCWRALLAAGGIEYLDAAEEETAMVAMTLADLARARARPRDALADVSYAHCEIHPSLIFGACGSAVPFPDHNQPVRNTMQAKMATQSCGIPLTNYQLRLDTTTHVLCDPQKPLVTTRGAGCSHFRELRAGQNAIVAIMCYSGYNQEDTVIMNQAFIDRGLFRSLYYRTIRDEEKTVDGKRGLKERIERPDPTKTAKMYLGSFDKLDSDGLVEPGTRISSGDAPDVVIGKTAPVAPVDEPPGEASRVNCSTLQKQDGIIDQVLLTENESGQKLVKVRARSVRVPQIGDKFSSRHGQKGVVGMTLPQEDMPFTRDGVTPDIIVNPHAIPGRMTIGHLIECAAGKAAACKGKEWDATPFADVTVESFPVKKMDETELKQLGVGGRCEICRRKLAVGDACQQMAPCGHVFHSDCLAPRLEEGNACPSCLNVVDQVSTALQACGYQNRGNEAMYNGKTGRKLEARDLCGANLLPAAQAHGGGQDLRQSKGPDAGKGSDSLCFFISYLLSASFEEVSRQFRCGPPLETKLTQKYEPVLPGDSFLVPLTRQPVKGRGKAGGLRFGEMERDRAIAHGAARFLKERMMDQSDACRAHLCARCGLLASARGCPGCATSAVVQVEIPYACKLLFQELMAMGIAPRMYA
ncbi:DNA-directed RNA polymerase II subunit 2 [Klebsormidium nitens]|uniref:DNA-directed RNA polymerase subunit beta n=1 Tax=Klebsormidium nitens TaxID=105231 RepID=A0A1Y1HQM8_KLENI|nr:DNA-directed RNA polymerase II subunit 2 [Klebsormidium nitens]|eukprot:GAQ80930.1 DNA-directed RNA polymerase II subunit 2 [Klebsormidium nitens]